VIADTAALLGSAGELQPRTVERRRDLHRHPELGTDGPRTQAAVLDAVGDLGLDVRTGSSIDVLQQVPGAMAFLGTCPPGVEFHEAAPNHSNRMVIDDDAMAVGVALHASVALSELGS